VFHVIEKSKTRSKSPKKGDGHNLVRERLVYPSQGSGLTKYSKRRDLQAEILPLQQPALT